VFGEDHSRHACRRWQRLEQARVRGLERPFDPQDFDARAHGLRQQHLDACGIERTHTRREPISLAGLGVERDAELAQLFHGLPDGGAGHAQLAGQCLARAELAVVEPLEYALGQRLLGGCH
jgi:hypothetical protein